MVPRRSVPEPLAGLGCALPSSLRGQPNGPHRGSLCRPYGRAGVEGSSVLVQGEGLVGDLAIAGMRRGPGPRPSGR